MTVDNEKKKAQKRKWWKKFYQKNKARVLAEKKAYRDSHRDVIRATQKVYRDSEKGRAKNAEEERQRRAKKKNCSVPLTAKEKQAMFAMENTRRTLQEQTGKKHDIDHIVPLDYGGIHHPCNLRVLDALDNNTKYNKITPESLALVGENYRLYRERIGLEKAEWFRNEIAQAIGLEMANRLIDSPDGAVPPTTPTLEDLLS